MNRQRKTTPVIFSNPSHQRSSESNIRHPSRRKRHLKNIVHVTIGLNNTVHPANNDIRSSKLQMVENNRSTKQSSIQTRISKNRSFFSNKSDIVNACQRAPTSKKKNKSTRQCFIASLLTTLLIAITILSISLALILTPQAKITPTTAPMLRWNTIGITIAGMTNSPGNGNNQLNIPLDVMPHWNDTFYVADYANHRIQEYLRDSAVGKSVAGTGVAGISTSQLFCPSRILIDSNENFYISDTCNHRIQFWKKGAANGTTIAGVTGSPGNATNQLHTPYGIALHPTSDALYIADYMNHRLMSYAVGDTNGTLLLGGIGPGIRSTQLLYPVGLAYESYSSSLIIANVVAQNVVRYVFGETNWTLVVGNINGTLGSGPTSLYHPIDMTYDPLGNLYVADRENHRIQFFSSGEIIGTTIAGITGVNGSNATTFNGPWAVRLDNQLNLYVADAFNHRIQKFLRY